MPVHGRGILFYIMGPSGAGKDALLRFVRGRIDGNHGIAFSHRYITRPADYGGENHVELSDGEFAERKAFGCFLMDWEAHGFKYAIGIEASIWLVRGLSVVVSGSRRYFSQALEIYPRIRGILVTASPEILSKRLAARGREDNAAILERSLRTVEFREAERDVFILENNSTLEEAGEKLIAYLLANAGK